MFLLARYRVGYVGNGEGLLFDVIITACAKCASNVLIVVKMLEFPEVNPISLYHVILKNRYYIYSIHLSSIFGALVEHREQDFQGVLF